MILPIFLAGVLLIGSMALGIYNYLNIKAIKKYLAYAKETRVIRDIYGLNSYNENTTRIEGENSEKRENNGHSVKRENKKIGGNVASGEQGNIEIEKIG